MKIQQALSEAQKHIQSETAKLDAEVLLAYVLNQSRTYLFTWPEKNLSKDEAQQFEALIQQRAKGTPIAYLTGSQEFWSMEFKVNEATLIPRPETELLVEVVLEHLNSKPLIIADFGTGSGAIACALASECAAWQLHAIDQSIDALEIAKQNAATHSLNNIHFYQSNWGDNCTEKLDAIVSNPPYIEDNDPHLTQGDVAFEPRTALSSGDDGLDDIRIICEQAQSLLKPNGWLFIEHGFDQGAAVRDILSQNDFSNIQTVKDLSGHERVSFARIESN